MTRRAHTSIVTVATTYPTAGSPHTRWNPRVSCHTHLGCIVMTAMCTTITHLRAEMTVLNSSHRKRVVPIYSCPQARDRCLVYMYILDKYISNLPEDAKEKDLFYLRPLESTTKTADELGISHSRH